MTWNSLCPVPGGYSLTISSWSDDCLFWVFRKYWLLLTYLTEKALREQTYFEPGLWWPLAVQRDSALPAGQRSLLCFFVTGVWRVLYCKASYPQHGASAARGAWRPLLAQAKPWEWDYLRLLWGSEISPMHDAAYCAHWQSGSPRFPWLGAELIICREWNFKTRINSYLRVLIPLGN